MTHQLPTLPAVERAHPHTPASFVRDFRGAAAEIRSWVNWDRLLTAPVTVQETLLSTKADIGLLETVWYYLPGGGKADWHDQAARRALINEVPNLHAFPSPRTTARIKLFVKWANATPAGTVVSVPAFRTHENGYVLLDGNHRASAIYQAAQDITLRVISIGGVDDPFLIPDMIHSTHQQATSAIWQAMCAQISAAYPQHEPDPARIFSTDAG